MNPMLYVGVNDIGGDGDGFMDDGGNGLGRTIS